MVKKYIGIFVLLSLLGIHNSCEYENEEDLIAEMNEQGMMNTCDDENVTYSGQISQIVARSCAKSGCHVPGGFGNGNFQDFGELQQRALNGRIEERAIITREMPLDGMSLTPCEIKQLQAWIDQGAPQN